MSIILAINDRCQIGADRYQWIVMRKKSEDEWIATTFWQHLNGAIKDCIRLGLAEPDETAKLSPLTLQLEEAEAVASEAINGALASIPDAAFEVSLGSDWVLTRDRLKAGARWRYHLIQKTPNDPSGSDPKDNRIGAYRSPAYALQQCVTIRLRLSDDVSCLENITQEVLRGASLAHRWRCEPR